MDKKFYVTPEMEKMNLKIETMLASTSYGAGDPGFNDEEPDPSYPIEVD